MTKWIMITICCFTLHTSTLSAQAEEAQQLLLNWEKLTQFKKILNNMYDGYKILHKGYTTIRNISESNFSLHKTFLDGLLQVSPAVRKYKRIADIINIQLRIVKEYKAVFNEFKQNKQFTTTEIKNIGNVYNNLFKESLQQIDELALVITSGKLRMSDDERLQVIDRVYDRITDQFAFLQEFNNNTMVLSIQRTKEQQEIELSRKLRGIK